MGLGGVFPEEKYPYDDEGYLKAIDRKWGAKKGANIEDSLIKLFNAVEELEKKVGG